MHNSLKSLDPSLAEFPSNLLIFSILNMPATGGSFADAIACFFSTSWYLVQDIEDGLNFTTI